MDDCKGIVWRGIKTGFIDDNGRIKESKEVRILKTKSCPGCGKCGWMIDTLQDCIRYEDYQDLLINIEHGKMYKVVFFWDGEDVDLISFVEYIEGDSEL